MFDIQSWGLSVLLPLTALTLLFVLLLPWLNRRCSARSLYAALLILLVAFLIPVRPAFLRIRLPQAAYTAPAPIAAPQPIGVPGEVAMQPILATNDSLLPESTAHNTARPPLSLRQGLLLAWGAGALAALIWHAVHHLRFARLLRRWAWPVENPITQELYAQVAAEEGVYGVPLCLCPALHTPMVAGLVRPRILLPDEKLSTSELHFVFRHELTHVKRRDLWVKALQGLALCLHWWNPAMHLLHRALQAQCESACDEALLRGASLPTRQFYSETILSVIRRQPHAAPIVSTGFYGGKKGMKKRITNILDMGHKRYGALLLAAVLLMSSLGVLAASDNAPSSPTAERQATKGYLTSPHGMIHVTGIPTDYDYPQMVYFSGVPVLMDELIHKETQFGFEDWIHISVPAGADETVMAGYTLLSNFVSAAEAPDSFYPFPTVTLNGDSITGTASLYLNNGLTNDVLGSYPNGTELTVLGFTRTHYQVLLDGHQGFVPRENVRMEGEGKSRITGAEPAHYDSHTPGREADYEAMNRRFQELTDTYGDINLWSIPMRARWSQEQIEADTLSDSPDIWVHLMPGQDDLTEEAARALADKALTGKDADPAAFLDVRSYYYVRNGERDKRLWQFSYRGGPDELGWVVQLNQAGEVVELRSFEDPGSPYPYDIISLSSGQVVQPQDGELTNTQAADIAWQRFAESYAEHNARDQYDITAALRTLYNMRYWVISIKDKPTGKHLEEYWYTFDVVLRASTGAIMYATSGEEYRSQMQEFDRIDQQIELEKERGPLFTWSLEDKAALYPGSYAVPQEGQMTQEQAWEIGVKALKEQKGWTDDLLTEWTPYYFFVLPDEGLGLPLRWDIQIYNNEKLAQNDLVGYYVCVDATNGDILWVYGPGETNG